MRYSEVLSGFYRIYFLNKEDADTCDLFFTAAAHEFWRSVEAKGTRYEAMHEHLWRRSLACLKYAISEYATFEFAIDPSCSPLGLDRPEGWSPFDPRLPDVRMFASLQPDNRFPIGMPHKNTEHLFDIRVHLSA